MNRERLELIASLLSDVDEESRTFVHEGTTYILRMNVGHKKDQCGTVCCIAGLAASLFDPEFITTEYTYPEWYGLSETARIALGLTDPQADALFLSAVAGPFSAIDVSPLQAAEAIERLVEGQFPWQRSHRFAETVVEELADVYPIGDLVDSFPNAPGSLWLDPSSGLIEQETE